MHVTYQDTVELFQRLDPEEQALVLREASAKGIEAHEILARGLENAVREGDRPTVSVLRSWHRSAKGPSVVLSGRHP